MTFKELFVQDEFKAVFNEIEQFSKKQLTLYNDMLEKKKLADCPKEIFDAVWGNVGFSAGEIYILDSPLLQRLRHIKQLGFADFVYCGCDYSRFYHTIGVVYLADRMSAAINKCEFGLNNKEKLYYKAVVRLAAIFHDAGHMFFSHASEHYFSKSRKYPRNDEILAMLDRFQGESGKRIALHELLGCMLVNTLEVSRLLKLVSKRISDISIEEDEDVEELTEYISCLISGVPIDSKILPYATIINGSIDADKCDYLSRDSHVTRVPVAVDMSRITQKLSVVHSDKINKSNLWKVETNRNIQYYELAMQDSAEKALFQLCIARTIMYDSVYYHHKVLTAETEFRNILDQLTHLENPLFLSFEEILSCSDYDFSRNTFELLKGQRKQKGFGSDVEKLDYVYKRLEQLYNRELAKRLVCILPEYLEGSQKNKEFLHDEVFTHIDTEGAEQLIKKIKEEFECLNEIIGEKEGLSNLNIYIIQAPIVAFGHSKIQVPIDLYNGTKREFKGNNMISSKETSSSASYIVSNAGNKTLAYLAIEKVLYRDYNVSIKSEGYACGKYKKEEIIQYATRLFDKGYYNDCPMLIPNELVENYISIPEIEHLVEKYASYEGEKGYKITDIELIAFIKQVLAAVEEKEMCRDIVRGVYILLDCAIFIDRKYFFNCMEDKIEEVNLKDKVAHMIPLGGARDSGKHYAYFWNDILKQNINIENTLAKLVEDPEITEIIFFDDGSFSGTQLLSILQEYMGVEKRETDEHHVDALTEKQCEEWKKKKTIFLFIAFNEAKKAEISKSIVNLGLSNFEFAFAEDLSKRCFGADGKIRWENDKQREVTKSLLENVGCQLMKSAKSVNGKLKKRWTEERVKKSALGYNDAQQMVILKSSVPTYTIVAFWQEGMVNDWKWKPLFKRTHKPD